MAVTSYASGDIDPISNFDVDPIIDLSVVNLPQNIPLYAGAFDSAHPANGDWTFTWTILDDDPDDATVLDDAAAQNPTATVPTWRNVRLFLVAANTNTDETSDNNPLTAPDSAFVVIRVQSPLAGLEKLAAGERNYAERVHAMVAAIEEQAAGVGEHAINDHTDATASVTGANLDILTAGGDAAGMHTHPGGDIGVATDTGLGVARLEETGAGAAKIITRERVTLTAHVDGSFIGLAYQNGVIVPDSYEVDQAVNGGKPLTIWRAAEALKILAWSIQMLNGGMGPVAAHPYRFRLGVANATDAATNTWADLGTQITGSPSIDNGVMLHSATLAMEHTVPAGEFIALFCCAAPRSVIDGEDPGGGLSVQIFARREVV